MTEPDLRTEVVDLAQALIAVDTSNPPGRETAAARLLAGYLRESGLEPELDGPDPERLNLIARLPGGDGPSLMLLAHTDVVPAPDEGWRVPPFEGRIEDGRLIGRGATDMKNELAARTVAFARFARSGRRPAGDVVLVAEADEERNEGACGMSWLADNRPDLACDLALNEGGGMLLELADGRRVVTVSVGEKRTTALRLRIFGTAGHGSVPTSEDNAVLSAARVVERLLGRQGEPQLVPALRRALEALGAPADDPERAVEWAASQNPLLGEEMPALTRLTVTPTGLRTYEPPNVIPPHADVICDCRTLPGQGEDEIRAHVAAVLGDGFRYELELLEPLEGGTESPLDTPLYTVLEDYVAERVPGAVLLPLFSTGFTDSHWIRVAFGTVAYGFAPVLHGDVDEYMRGAHARDEAIELDDLVEMCEFHLRAIEALG